MRDFLHLCTSKIMELILYILFFSIITAVVASYFLLFSFFGGVFILFIQAMIFISIENLKSDIRDNEKKIIEITLKQELRTEKIEGKKDKFEAKKLHNSKQKNPKKIKRFELKHFELKKKEDVIIKSFSRKIYISKIIGKYNILFGILSILTSLLLFLSIYFVTIWKNL